MITAIAPEDLLKRYRAGLNLRHLKTVSKLSIAEISRRLRRLNPSYIQTKRWRPERREAFLLFVKGWTLRKIARQYNVSHATVRRWFVAMHPDYNEIAHRGVFASTRDFLNSKQAKRFPRKATEVETWFLRELPTLVETETKTEIRTYSSSKERRLTYLETSRYDDFRETLR